MNIKLRKSYVHQDCGFMLRERERERKREKERERKRERKRDREIF